MAISTRSEPSIADAAGRDTSVSRPAAGGGVLASLAGGTVGILVIAALAGALFVASFGSGSQSTDGPVIDQLRSWVAEHPDDADAWRQLGDQHLIQATALDDTASYLAARTALDRSLALDPDRPETLRSLAVASVGLHRFAAGEDFALRTLAVIPQDRVAMAALVDAQIEVGNYDDAEVNADALAALRPDAISLPRLSYVHQLRGDLDQALDLMFAARTAATGSPAQVARIDFFLAELQLQIGDSVSARSFYEQAASHESMAGRAYVAMAQLAVERGDAAAALELLDRPGVADAGLATLETRARLAALIDDQDGVDRLIEQIRGVVDGSMAAGIGIEASVVVIEADLGDPTRAVELADVLLAAQPGNIAANDAVAWAAHRNGDRAVAEEHIELALRTGTLDPQILAHAAAIRDEATP